MDKFREKFVEEAIENIAELEKALLALEQQEGSEEELVERVFRAMHSLKGGASMFGFQKISDFTHHLENIYDKVREGKLKVTKGLLDITLQAVDHLKLLIEKDEELNREAEANHKNLLVQVIKLLEEKEDKGSVSNKQEGPSSDSQQKTYYVYFQPNKDIFDNGTNPLFLLDELSTLGDLKALPCLSEVPDLENIDPLKCYTHWEVIIATADSEEAIHDVFIFVEDQAKIDIYELSEQNLLQNPRFLSEIEKLSDLKKDIGVDAIKSITNSIQGAKEDLEEQTRGKDTKTVNGKDYSISSIRVASEKIDHMMNLVSELVTTQARLSLKADQSDDGELATIAENVQKLTRQLRDNAFDIALVPVETMLTRFQRLVRDLAGSMNKKVTLVAEGTDTELDKNIIETLTDPLLHIIRNSIDHGIETPEERKRKGKPEEGKILLKAYYSGAKVHIQIHDDGQGIDIEKVKNKAIQKNIIEKNQELSRRELFDLIFKSGFSTSENVTDVSGRGVGMDVVRRKLSEIRGEVEIDSELDAGTTLTVKLPLTLSIIDGLLVRIDNDKYIVPLSAVDKIYAAQHSDVVDTFNNLITLDGEQVPFFYLRKEFGIPEAESDMEEIVVVRYEDIRIGLVVDAVVGEYQAVLKSLGKMYKQQDIISGATILGDGTVALVFDTNKMIDQFAGRKAEKSTIVEK
ncbi:MAG: chemotaxis protein CheA [Bacteroidota bacterium]